MRNCDIVEVIWMLIGPVIPVGEAHIDPVRLDNLKTLLDVTAALIDQIKHAASGKDSHMASVRKAGVLANEHLVILRDRIETMDE